jgi:hypothetical protein
MPQIIVTAEAAGGPDGATMTLRERVSPADFESERFLANLLERLGWAVEDATAAEQRDLAGVRDRPEHQADPQPDRDPEPVGVA